MYSERARVHCAAPGKVSGLADPSRTPIVKSPVDNATVLITLSIERGSTRDVRFSVWDGAAAIACSSMVTEMVLGKSMEGSLTDI
jgi:NifU-like protein involved in Fe-S cluster formation